MISANSSVSACQGTPKLKQSVVAIQSVTAREPVRNFVFEA